MDDALTRNPSSTPVIPNTQFSSQIKRLERNIFSHSNNILVTERQTVIAANNTFRRILVSDPGIYKEPCNENHWPFTTQENRKGEELDGHEHDRKRTGKQLCERTGTKTGRAKSHLGVYWGFNSVVKHCCSIREALVQT